MTGTIEAIQDWWTSHALSALFADHTLWFGEAPIGTLTPYAVLILVSEPVASDTTAFQLVEGRYQLNCMAGTAAQAVGLARTVRQAFHKARLTQMDDASLHCLGGEISLTKGVGLGTDGADCWVAYTELEILAQRT